MDLPEGRTLLDSGYKQKRQNAGADFVSVPLHSFIQLLILKDVKQ
ncbi:hypothetical protein [Leptospira interrogans]|nr:hypothetical protein [Leptospira interrogans]